jgi:hypothetical protein
VPLFSWHHSWELHRLGKWSSSLCVVFYPGLLQYAEDSVKFQEGKYLSPGSRAYQKCSTISYQSM